MYSPSASWTMEAKVTFFETGLSSVLLTFDFSLNVFIEFAQFRD